MSMVARMKEQFKGSGGVTPEQHKVLVKSQKEKEEQAVLIAKARAARYNMTLRTADLQSSTPSSTGSSAAAPRPDPSKIVKGTTADDYKNKKAPAVEAATEDKPNPFKIQLRKTGGPSAKVAEALHHNRDPGVAKALVEVAAQAAVAAPVAEEKPPSKTEAQVVVLEAKAEKEVVVVEVHEEVVAVLEEAKVEVTPTIVETLKTEAAPAVVGQEFEMVELKKAVESGDGEKINQAVVTEFLETHAPELVPEVPKLMEEFKGHEADLMEKLADEHPDPAEKIEAEAVAIITGETKPSAEDKKEIEEAHQEEQAKVAELSTEERATHEAVKEALEEHAVAKDAILKENLEEMQKIVDSSSSTEAAAAETSEAPAEAATSGFILSGVNTEGQWQVNTEEGAQAETAAE